MSFPELAPADRTNIEAQLGRPLRGRSRVVSRCALELPVVTQVHPDCEGRPFPTLYWLTCPLARTRVSRLEQVGMIRQYTEQIRSSGGLKEGFGEVQQAYARERAKLLPAESPLQSLLRGGVGGAEGGVKCLHAHYAHARSGGTNPIGDDVAARVEPLDCAQPCVRGASRNPAWREPPLSEGASQ